MWTNDVWFMAFLIQSGHTIGKYEIEYRTKLKCFFEIDKSNWQELKLKFNSSEVNEIKQIVMQVKGLLK